MKWILILFLLLSGCATEWYPNGQKKREGFLRWSSGKDSVIKIPVSGVGL